MTESIVERLLSALRIAGFALLPPALMGAASPAGILQVDVTNVRAATGVVHVEVCTEALFLKNCPAWTEPPSSNGATRVTVRGLPPGRYAVQAYYDQNGNKKVDRALFGIPKEGVGFSNDARIRLGPPKWSEAAFDYDGGAQTIRLKLRYFIGPDAPAGR